MSQRPTLAGRSISVRLPLGADSELRSRAKSAATTPGRMAVTLLTAALAESTDGPVSVNVTMSGRLYAALVHTGAVKATLAPAPSAEIEASEPSASTPVDGNGSNPEPPTTIRKRDREHEGLRIPSQAELDAKGGVGEVEGCEHKHSVPVGALRRCAVCKAFRGLDGVWRAG